MGRHLIGKSFLMGFSFLLALNMSGCSSKVNPLVEPHYKLKRGEAKTQDVEIEDTFYLDAFNREKKILQKYVYILTGNLLPQDKIKLGSISVNTHKDTLPTNFNYYTDLIETLGSYLYLVDSDEYDEKIEGSVVLEPISTLDNEVDGDVESYDAKGTGSGSASGGGGIYRIRMDLQMVGYDGRIDAATKNSIIFRRNNSGVSVALSFLTFSIGMNRDITDSESITRTLQALADFSLIQIIGKNYLLPYWYAFEEKYIGNRGALIRSRQEMYEKYYYAMFHRYRKYFPPYLVMKRAMVILFGVPVNQINFGLPEEFTSTERAYFNRIIQYLLTNRQKLGLTPQEVARLQNGTDLMKISTILVVVNPLKTPSLSPVWASQP